MKINKQTVLQQHTMSKEEITKKICQDCWEYFKTVLDIVREPILILDKNLNVVTANDSFLRMFQMESKDIEHKLVYKLNDGQWNIPSLHTLLEDILPKNLFFKGFEITHDFPFIGRKNMTVNARQINFSSENSIAELSSPIVFLAIEDTTAIMTVAETLTTHVKEVSSRNTARTHKLEMYIEKLEKEINEIKENL